LESEKCRIQHLIGPRPWAVVPTVSICSSLMLSEPSSGEYRYPDLKFMVRIHHVTERRIDGVGKGGKGGRCLELVSIACSIFISARIHSNFNTCY